MNEQSIEDINSMLSSKMNSSIESLKEFNTVSTGRATPVILEPIKVDYYGSPTPLSQIASVSAPEPQLVIINPWEKTQIKEIERAIQKANIGLSLSNDGNVIRAVVPMLTEERRKELAKQVKKIGEDNKVAIRNIRRDANEKIKKLQKDKVISQDDEKTSLASTQTITDKFIGVIDELTTKKEKDLLTV